MWCHSCRRRSLLNAPPVLLFFFSSRRRHTRFDCDWSSDVCSSDLIDVNEERIGFMLVAVDITSEKRIRSTMARYMSPEVAEQLLASGEAVLGGKDQKVSILFSDIRKIGRASCRERVERCGVRVSIK